MIRNITKEELKDVSINELCLLVSLVITDREFGHQDEQEYQIVMAEFETRKGKK